MWPDKRIAYFIPCFLTLLLLLTACGRNRPAPTATAQPPPAVQSEQPSQDTPVPPPPASLALFDTELLGSAGISAACDHPAEAELTCIDEATHPHLTVDVNAATFARWSLRWSQAERPLTGTETLRLHIRRTGQLFPNLYLVEEGGNRISVRLGQYGLADDWKTLLIPLGEIRSDEGHQPDFPHVNELQIVFEWADMAGELEIESLRFDSVWRESVGVADSARAQAGALTRPTGFVITPIATNLPSMTQIQFAPDGSMLVSLQNGRVWWYRDVDSDGSYEQRHLYTAGVIEVVGLLFDPVDHAVWLGGRGQLFRTLDSDGNGVADVHELRVDGLPWGRHQNNGLAWNPDPDPFTGEEGPHWLYFGLGSTEDLEIGGELNAAILRFPRDGQGQGDLEVVSRGNRNPYMVVWAPVPVELSAPDGPTAWQLFASENGPDFNDAPDEVNHIRWQHHYGFPERFGPESADLPAEIDELPYSGSLYAVTPHASASGLAYVSNPAWPAEFRTLYVTLFGQVFSPDIVGHTVERISLEQLSTPTGESYGGQPSTFIAGLDRPLPMIADPNGDLVVGDYATGIIYRVTYSAP